MTDYPSPFEYAESFEAGELSGAVRLGRFESHYEELFAEAIEDGVITAEERQSLDRTAAALGLDRDRLRKLELALQASYEARHRRRVLEVADEAEAAQAQGDLPPEPIASIAPLAPSDDPRVQAYERRIEALQARIVELERELEEARSHAAVDVDLSGVSAGAAPDLEAEDPEDLHRRYRHDPRDVDLLHAMYRALGHKGELDRQLCVAQALVFLDVARPEELGLYQELRGEGLIRPRAALERESWRRFLFHPEEEPLTGEIFSVVVGPVLLGRLAALRRDKALPSLDPARLQDAATSTLQAVRCFAWAAAILGMPVPPLYADPDVPSLVDIVPGKTPASRLGKQALSGRTPSELAFIAGRHLSFFREDHFVRALLPSIPDLEDIFLAALSIGNPGLPMSAPVKTRVAPIAQAIEPILEPAQIDRLRGHFLRFVEDGGRTNLHRWATAVDFTASRAGLLLSNDIASAHKMIAIEDPLHADERTDDLLVFLTSDRYNKLRQRLGIAASA